MSTWEIRELQQLPFYSRKKMISYVYLGILKYVISSCPAEIEGFSPFFCDGVGARAVVTRHLMWEGSMLLRSGRPGLGNRRAQGPDTR